MEQCRNGGSLLGRALLRGPGLQAWSQGSATHHLPPSQASREPEVTTPETEANACYEVSQALQADPW